MAEDDGKWSVNINRHKKNAEFAENLKKKGVPIEKNGVKTSKYTFYDFLFINLGLQFSRLANVYFLVISLLQLLTPLSPTGRYSTAVPLLLVVLVNMVREIWEDSQRHADDYAVNHRLVDVLINGKFEKGFWKDISVGNIIKMYKGQELPADIIQLSSSEPQGCSYIDTCNLDGETNLKLKSSVSVTASAIEEARLADLRAVLEYEPPNKRLYRFAGTLAMAPGGDKVPIDNDSVLLRGSVLRNTGFVHGLVVYAGRQSKIQMNSKRADPKTSNVERMSNWILAGVLAFELVMCSLGSLGNYLWAKGNPGFWYLPFVQKATSSDAGEAWVTYFILLNNYIPISLYVSVELAKLGQKGLIDDDLEMYHEPTDTPCQARTSNLNEELGQVQYVFSDKTGTLTRNEMEFRKCWIAGETYGFGTTEIGQAAADALKKRQGTAQPPQTRNLGSSDPGGAHWQPQPLVRDRQSTAGIHNLYPAAGVDDIQPDPSDFHAQYFPDPKISFDDSRLLLRLQCGHAHAVNIRDFLRVLSVAHTVVPEIAARPIEESAGVGRDGSSRDRQGEKEGKLAPADVLYQAESPDEGALVLAARALGFFFCGKTAGTQVVNVFGKIQRFKVLNLNKFNSSRKRMSMVIRTPEGCLELFVKGADNVMLPRLRPEQNYADLDTALRSFGSEGLRTLVIARKSLSEEEYQDWNKGFNEAATALANREEKLSEAAEQIEQNLELLGATAIEDKLQEGVPDAVATLRKAGIRVWVLTGDKQETAVNIGFACQLIDFTMTEVCLVDDDVDVLRTKIHDALVLYGRRNRQPREDLYVLVDGKALLHILKAAESSATDTDDAAAERALMLNFLDLTNFCRSVIACRVSPDQKRQIVAMVMGNVKPQPLTLSIGDGANDVPMILEASVGVGISGNEGMQAVRSSDYAIAQFAYLKRLLLVHGRDNYRRTSVVILYCLYKNAFLVTTLFLFSFYAGWTGTALFDSLMLAGFNVGWSFVGIIIYGIIDRDVSPRTVLANPGLYLAGIRKEEFSITRLIVWEVTGFVHTVVCLLVPVYAFNGKILLPEGFDAGFTVFGLCVLQVLVAAVNLKLMFQTSLLTGLSAFACLGSIALFIGGSTSHSTWALSSFFSYEWYSFYDIAMVLYGSAATFLVELLTVVMILIPDAILEFYRRAYFPRAADICREMDLGFNPGYRTGEAGPGFCSGCCAFADESSATTMLWRPPLASRDQLAEMGAKRNSRGRPMDVVPTVCCGSPKGSSAPGV